MAKIKIIWSNRAQIKLFEILDFYTDRNKNTTYSHKVKGEIDCFLGYRDAGKHQIDYAGNHK